jgi:hypothetical protein
MIIAELHGKLSSKLEDKEDILTSNVFSFFKYSNRQLLKEYLSLLSLDISLQDCKNAEFIFWPNYDDGTQPDLVINCGKYYILFEAKLNSDFSPESDSFDSQISREIKMGRLAAENENKDFVYVVITREYHKSRTKYSKYENQNFIFIWTNWQTITLFIENNSKYFDIQHDNEFANDLHSLLVKKKLRSYIGIINLKHQYNFDGTTSIFYNIKSSIFKGEFSGFINNLKDFLHIEPFHKIFRKSFFQNIKSYKVHSNGNIFYYGK